MDGQPLTRTLEGADKDDMVDKAELSPKKNKDLIRNIALGHLGFPAFAAPNVIYAVGEEMFPFC